MTIASGSQILASDVNNAHKQALVNIQVDNNKKPQVFWYNFQFNNIKLQSTKGEKTRLFISPDNYILDEVRVTTTNITSSLTASIDSGFMLRPIQISSSGNNLGSIDSLPSYFQLTGTLPYQPILRGNEYTITINTKVTGPDRNSAIVSLGLRSMRRRE